MTNTRWRATIGSTPSPEPTTAMAGMIKDAKQATAASGRCIMVAPSLSHRRRPPKARADWCAQQLAQLRSERASELRCRVRDPSAHQAERRDAGEAAAAGVVGAGRPAHDGDKGEPAAAILEHRPAGIAAANAEPRALASASAARGQPSPHCSPATRRVLLSVGPASVSAGPHVHTRTKSLP